MSRKRNKVKTQKVQPSVSREMVSHLTEMVDLGYGNTPTEVAGYLIKRGVDDVLRVGLVGPGLRSSVKRRK